MWEEAGFEVTIDQIPQGEFIGQAIGGNFQVFGWRNHAGVDPDQQYVVVELGPRATGLALNFGRIIDDEVDRLLDQIRTEHRRGRPQRRPPRTSTGCFAEQVFNVWTNWVYWGSPTATTCYNVGGHAPSRTCRTAWPSTWAPTSPGVIMPTEIFMTS